MYRILVIEDDAEIADLIQNFFGRRNECEVEIAPNGETGEECLYEYEYDLVLLDVMMPGIDGFEVCRDIRDENDIPIIFLTARGQMEDVLHGYSLGCDDYVVKPFRLEELYAKCMALLKRSKGLIRDSFISWGNIKLNPVTLEVLVNNEIIDLPRKEIQILRLLMESEGKVVPRETILTKVWGYDSDVNERVVDNRIKNLRKLLGEEGSRIKTVFTRGYRLS